MIRDYKDGDHVQIKASWAGHNKEFGTITRVVRRQRDNDLIYVVVKGVARELMFYPADLELA